MNHTLVTFLGKSRESKDTGYRKTVYRFPNGAPDETAFFGLALSRHLKPDDIVILGTHSSQWDVLVEHLAEEGEAEDARIQLIDAATSGNVTPSLLGDVAPLMRRAVDCDVHPRLILFGQSADEQYDILNVVADAVPNGDVSFDLTHGFRHLGTVGFLSAFMLERVRDLTVRGLWYGALDMTRDGITPVLELDGLVRVKRWMDALNQFDATGDYGVFAQLLKDDGVLADKADCLKDAAFHERTFNVRDAARKIGTFLPVLDGPLTGASGLFQCRLTERLRWATAHDLAEQQRKLAHQYLDRGDFVRAAVFGWEACVTCVCEERGVSTVDFSKKRKATVKEFENELRDGKHSEKRTVSYWTLTNIRNALVHGTRLVSPSSSRRLNPRGAGMAAAANALKDSDRLRHELQAALNHIFDSCESRGMTA